MAHLLIHRGLAKKNFVENSISAFKYCFKKKYGHRMPHLNDRYNQ